MARRIVQQVAVNEKKEVAKLVTFSNTLKNKNEELLGQINERKETLGELDKRLARQSNLFDSTEINLHNAQDTLKKLGDRLENVKQALKDHESQLEEKIISTKKEIEERTVGATEETNTLVANNEAIKADIEKNKKKNIDLAAESNRLSQINKQLDDKSKDLIVKNNILKMNIARNLETLKAQDSTVSATEDKKNSMKKTIIELNKEITDKEETIRNYSLMIKDQETKLKELVYKCTEKEKELEDKSLVIGQVSMREQKNKEVADKLQRKASQMGINIKLD